MAVLYHITREEDERDLSKGYIGITENFEERLERHLRGWGGSIRVHQEFLGSPSLSYSIVGEGSIEDMAKLEKILRPRPNMGWNIAAGGGYPPSKRGISMSQSTKDKIGKANSGRNGPGWKGYWHVGDQIFESSREASLALGVSKRTVMNRAYNPNFPDWWLEERCRK